MKANHFAPEHIKKLQETIMAFPDKITSVEQLRGLPGIGETIIKKFNDSLKQELLKLFKRKGHPRYIFAQVYGIGLKEQTTF